MCSSCGSPSKVTTTCSMCNSVFYCSDICGQIDRKNHTIRCQLSAHLVKKLAERLPLSNEEMGHRLHALDLLQSSRNECRNNSDNVSSLSLYRLLVFDSDIRHVVRTLVSNPKGRMEFHLVMERVYEAARSILLLAMLRPLNGQRHVKPAYDVAKFVTQIMYSFRLDQEIFQILCDTLEYLLKPKTREILTSKTAPWLSLSQPEYIEAVTNLWQAWLDLARSQDSYAKLELARKARVSSLEYVGCLESYMQKLPEKYRESVQSWVLFGDLRDKHSEDFYPNVTLTSLEETQSWPKLPMGLSLDSSSTHLPFRSWDFAEVKELNDNDETDLVVMYKNYLKNVFTNASEVLGRGTARVKIVCSSDIDAILRPFSLTTFDRIETAGLADRLGTPKILHKLRPLLNSQNRYSCIITHHYLWTAEGQTNSRNLLQLSESEKRGLLSRYLRAEILKYSNSNEIPSFTSVTQFEKLYMRNFHQYDNRVAPFSLHLEGREPTLPPPLFSLEWLLQKNCNKSSFEGNLETISNPNQYRPRSRSLDSQDTLQHLESQRMHKLAFQKARAKFSKGNSGLPPSIPKHETRRSVPKSLDFQNTRSKWISRSTSASTSPTGTPLTPMSDLIQRFTSQLRSPTEANQYPMFSFIPSFADKYSLNQTDNIRNEHEKTRSDARMFNIDGISTQVPRDILQITTSQEPQEDCLEEPIIERKRSIHDEAKPFIPPYYIKAPNLNQGQTDQNQQLPPSGGRGNVSTINVSTAPQRLFSSPHEDEIMKVKSSLQESIPSYPSANYVEPNPIFKDHPDENGARITQPSSPRTPEIQKPFITTPKRSYMYELVSPSTYLDEVKQSNSYQDRSQTDKPQVNRREVHYEFTPYIDVRLPESNNEVQKVHIYDVTIPHFTPADRNSVNYQHKTHRRSNSIANPSSETSTRVSPNSHLVNSTSSFSPASSDSRHRSHQQTHNPAETQLSRQDKQKTRPSLKPLEVVTLEQPRISSPEQLFSPSFSRSNLMRHSYNNYNSIPKPFISQHSNNSNQYQPFSRTCATIGSEANKESFQTGKINNSAGTTNHRNNISISTSLTSTTYGMNHEQRTVPTTRNQQDQSKWYSRPTKVPNIGQASNPVTNTSESSELAEERQQSKRYVSCYQMDVKPLALSNESTAASEWRVNRETRVERTFNKPSEARPYCPSKYGTLQTDESGIQHIHHYQDDSFHSLPIEYEAQLGNKNVDCWSDSNEIWNTPSSEQDSLEMERSLDEYIVNDLPGDPRTKGRSRVKMLAKRFSENQT